MLKSSLQAPSHLLRLAAVQFYPAPERSGPRALLAPFRRSGLRHGQPAAVFPGPAAATAAALGGGRANPAGCQRDVPGARPRAARGRGECSAHRHCGGDPQRGPGAAHVLMQGGPQQDPTRPSPLESQPEALFSVVPVPEARPSRAGRPAGTPASSRGNEPETFLQPQLELPWRPPSLRVGHPGPGKLCSSGRKLLRGRWGSFHGVQAPVAVVPTPTLVHSPSFLLETSVHPRQKKGIRFGEA